MAGERHGRGTGTAWHVWISLYPAVRWIWSTINLQVCWVSKNWILSSSFTIFVNDSCWRVFQMQFHQRSFFVLLHYLKIYYLNIRYSQWTLRIRIITDSSLPSLENLFPSVNFEVLGSGVAEDSSVLGCYALLAGKKWHFEGTLCLHPQGQVVQGEYDSLRHWQLFTIRQSVNTAEDLNLQTFCPFVHFHVAQTFSATLTCHSSLNLTRFYTFTAKPGSQIIVFLWCNLSMDRPC
jgi:hypothetical protein